MNQTEQRGGMIAQGSRPGALLAVILAVALVQGLLYLILIPPWQHYDEPTHFEYAWLLAHHGGLARAADIDPVIRREIAVSMVRHHFYAGQVVPDLTNTPDPVSIGFAELDHPPGYYLLLSMPLRLVSHWDVTAQLYVGRLVSLLLFLLLAAVTYGCTRDLVPAGHGLRWAVPLTVVLLPTVGDIMTAVNNDVGAILVFSLFLWCAVRTIRYGITAARIVGLITATTCAIEVKRTAGVALGLVPLILVVAIWVQRGWHWRWLLLLLGTGAMLLGVSLCSWGDAAYWYRWQVGKPQTFPTRVQDRLEQNAYDVVIEASPGDPLHYLLNPILASDVNVLAGQTVTVGGWISATQPVTVTVPGLVVSPQSTTSLIGPSQLIRVTTTPTFVAKTLVVPQNTGMIYYAVFGNSEPTSTTPVNIFLRHPVLASGAFPTDIPPVFTDPAARSGVWGGQAFTNYVRNAGALETWPRLRQWVQVHVIKSLSLDHYLDALLDVRQNGPLLAWTADPWLVAGFFGRFAWGHILLPGWNQGWLYVVHLLGLAAMIGALRWVWGRRKSQRPGLRPALTTLLIAALVVWGLAVLWPLPYRWARPTLPSARYVFPALIPTILMLTGGWWALWPPRYGKTVLAAWLAGVVVLDMTAVMTIWMFYQHSPMT